MRQENSVLFALADLRSLESERVAEQERAEAERQRAEAERRLADEQRQAALARRELEERQALSRALEQAAGRNEQLESDVQTLRALVSAVRPEPVERRLWPLALVAAAGVALAIVLVASQRPVVRERVVYVPAPVATTAPPVPAPVPPPRPTIAPAPPVSAARVRPPAKKRIPTAPPKVPEVDTCGGKDPLCGLHL